MTSILKVQLKNGKVLSGRAEFAKGSPANPMSYDEVADKFRGCAEFTKWPTAKTEAVITAVKSLESLAELGKLTAALTA
jgi:2-methylcitrate dehydratase PrpD